jgi:hypothetical protein
MGCGQNGLHGNHVNRWCLTRQQENVFVGPDHVTIQNLHLEESHVMGLLSRLLIVPVSRIIHYSEIIYFCVY